MTKTMNTHSIVMLVQVFLVNSNMYAPSAPNIISINWINQSTIFTNNQTNLANTAENINQILRQFYGKIEISRSSTIYGSTLL